MDFLMTGPSIDEDGNSYFKFPSLFPEHYQAKLVLNPEGKFNEVRFNFLNITLSTEGFEQLENPISNFSIPRGCKEVSTEELNTFLEALKTIISGALGKDHSLSSLFDKYRGTSPNPDFKSKNREAKDSKIKETSEIQNELKKKEQINEL